MRAVSGRGIHRAAFVQQGSGSVTREDQTGQTNGSCLHSLILPGVRINECKQEGRGRPAGAAGLVAKLWVGQVEKIQVLQNIWRLLMKIWPVFKIQSKKSLQHEKIYSILKSCYIYIYHLFNSVYENRQKEMFVWMKEIMNF